MYLFLLSLYNIYIMDDDDGDVPDESNGPNLIRDFVKMGGGSKR